MKTELTPDKAILIGKIKACQMILSGDEINYILSLLTKQDEQPQADDAEEWLNESEFVSSDFIEIEDFDNGHSAYGASMKKIAQVMQAFHEAMSREDKEKLKSYEDGFWGRMASKNLTKYQQAQVEIQSLKQANADLVKKGYQMIDRYKKMTGVHYDPYIGEFLQALSKHDKQ